MKQLSLSVVKTLLLMVAINAQAAPDQHPNGWFWPTGSATDPGDYFDWRHPNYQIHIGEDWKHVFEIGQPLYALSDGVIHSYSSTAGYYGDNCGGIGGALSVQYETSNGQVFYALYGHNYLESGLSVGSEVNAGQIIARSHIHYQDCARTVRSDHLHFGIHPGTPDSNPYRGRSETSNDRGWVNPTVFLNTHYPSSFSRRL